MPQPKRDNGSGRQADQSHDDKRSQQSPRTAADADRLRGDDLPGDDPEGESCVVIHHRDEKESDS
jgi:hypothetical protein